MVNKKHELYVLRHGETYWNREGRTQGHLHSDLTQRGRDQARRQGELLVELGLMGSDIPIFISPQGRTQQTAEIALAPLGRWGVLDARLMEIGCGTHEGKSIDELEAASPGVGEARNADFLAWLLEAPGGESSLSVESRARAFLEEMDGPAIIVSHGITTRYLRGAWLGMSFEEMKQLPGDQGCVYHLKDGVHRVIT